MVPASSLCRGAKSSPCAPAVARCDEMATSHRVWLYSFVLCLCRKYTGKKLQEHQSTFKVPESPRWTLIFYFFFLSLFFVVIVHLSVNPQLRKKKSNLKSTRSGLCWALDCPSQIPSQKTTVFMAACVEAGGSLTWRRRPRSVLAFTSLFSPWLKITIPEMHLYYNLTCNSFRHCSFNHKWSSYQ